MKEENLIYKRINEKIQENNGFDELVIFDIENVYGCNSIKTKNKERKTLKVNRAKKRLKNFDNYFNLTRNSLIIISANRRLLEDLDKLKYFKGFDFFDRNKIEGSMLDVDEIMKIIKNLKNLEISEMLKHPCIRDRYPLLLNGIEILEKILENFQIKKILVSQGGLTEGMIENLS